MGIGKLNSPRCDAAEGGVPSGDILFAYINVIKLENLFMKHNAPNWYVTFKM